MSRRGTATATPGPRRGFTLVELMVTIVLLTVGMLGMAGTTAMMTRQIGGGARMALAATAAQARFETLRSADCASLSAGSASARGITEVWTVTALPRAVQITDTVKFATTRGQRTHAYRSLIPCPDLP
ncbi:MAG TPA: prepilin-type N-terminal cleavage/methylation domain-containing protein [Gemmatimonadaceae bacterium]|nr:prepilin-type N-terminal cleavage/methylation domain-containing protein [Gemmatimonadaceae bacterium]